MAAATPTASLRPCRPGPYLRPAPGCAARRRDRHQNENDADDGADDGGARRRCGCDGGGTAAEPSTDHLLGRRRSAAIYGTIITAAVLAAGGNALSTVALEATVFVTVMVYWLAEQYAVLLGEHTHSGQLPSKAEIVRSMRSSFPMVTSSLIPLLVLFVGRLSGLTAFHAAAVAIFATVLLLIYHGHAAGREAGLTGAKLLLVTATAGVLGLVMIALKTLLQHQHHLY